MHTIGLLINIGFLAVTLYIGWNVYSQWRKETTKTGWDRLLAAARDSATILWGKFALFISGIIANVDTIFNALGMDSVSNFINQWVNPKVAAAIIAAISVGSMLARLRTLGTSIAPKSS